MNVWMQITKDKYELPVAVANTANELAEIVGVDVSAVRSAVSKQKTGKRKVTKYIKVVVEDD